MNLLVHPKQAKFRKTLLESKEKVEYFLKY